MYSRPGGLSSDSRGIAHAVEMKYCYFFKPSIIKQPGDSGLDE